MPDQLSAIQEWIDSLPWPTRWALKGSLIAGGHMDWTGHLKPVAGNAIGCLLIIIVALVISMCVAWR